MKRRHNSPGGGYSAGFSLIEVLISFVVLAVGLLTLLSFHSTTQRNVADAKIQAEAVALAEGKLQELESFLTDTDGRLDIATTTEPVIGALANYTLTWTVDEHTDPDLASIRVVQVDVSWADRDGINQQVSLASDIRFVEPTAGIQDFLKLAAAVKNPGTGGGNWVGDIPENGDEPDQGGGDGDGETGGEGGTDEGGDGTVVTTYSISISGMVTVPNGNNNGSLTGVQVINQSDVSPDWSNCSFSTNTSYSCTSSPIPIALSWVGQISFTSDQTVCTPTDGIYGQLSASSTNRSITGKDVVIKKLNKNQSC